MRSELNEQVICKPIGKVSPWRRLLSYLPHHCSYCGKHYVPCHSGEVSILIPLPQNGYCCPDGHEGYVREFLGHSYNVKHFDYIKEGGKQ